MKISTRRVQIGFEEEKYKENEAYVEENNEFFVVRFGVIDEMCHLEHVLEDML